MISPINEKAIKKLRERVNHEIILHYYMYEYECDEDDYEHSRAGAGVTKILLKNILAYPKDEQRHIVFIVGNEHQYYNSEIRNELAVFSYGRKNAGSGWAHSSNSEEILTGISINNELIWDSNFAKPPCPGGLGQISKHLKYIEDALYSHLPDKKLSEKVCNPLPGILSIDEYYSAPRIELDYYKELEKYLIKLV